MTSIKIETDVSEKVVQKNAHHPESHDDNDGEDQSIYPLSVIAARNNIASVDLAQENHKQATLMTHNDCGSNQSGSDSGLGYTNSLSSENNSLLANSADEPDQRPQNSVGGVNDVCIVKSQVGTASFAESQHRRRRLHEDKLALLSSSLLCKTSIEKIVLNTTDDTHLSATCALAPPPSSTQASLAAAQIDLNNKFEEHNNANIEESRGSNYNTDKGGGTRESRVSLSNIENVSPCLSTSSMPLSQVKDEQRLKESTSRTGQDNGLVKAATSTSHHRHHHHDHPPRAEETAAAAAASATPQPLPPPPPPTTTTTAKIKHSSSTKNRPHETASSMPQPSVTTTSRTLRQTDRDGPAGDATDELDQITEHERLREHGSAHRERVSPSSVTRSLGATLKSCIKSIAHLDKPIKRRNVSFNQTVIVFCEEIDPSSSPCDTFEPPFNYRDASSRVKYDQNDSAVSSNSQGLYETTDDLEIINKIVGEDASNLTDDQLIGLLENGSLLESFDLTSADKFTINRMNSGQSYLCHGAISDSDSESSLVEEDAGKRRGTTHKARHSVSSSTKITQGSKVAALSSEKDAANQAPRLQDGQQECIRTSEQIDMEPQEESQIETIPRSGQQKSMPARVKVTTVDSYNQHGKRGQENLVPTTNPQVPNRRQITSAQSQHKVIPILVDTQSQIPVDRQHFNTDQRLNAKHNGVVYHQNLDEQHSAPEVCDPIHIPAAGAKSNATGGFTTRFRQDQILSWAINETDTRQLNLSEGSVRGVPTSSNDAHNNPACHVCRAIESNRLQSNHSRGDRGALMALQVQNPNSSLHRTPPLNTGNRSEPVQLVQAPYHSNQTVAVNSVNDSSVAKQQQIVPECVSCRGISIHQQQQREMQQIYGTHTMRPIPTSQPAQQLYQHSHLAAQQATKPIACQLVYVVDQHGNRIRALQVMRPKQNDVVASGGGLQHQHLQQPNARQIGANNYRFANPTSTSNAQQIIYRVSSAQPASCNSIQEYTEQIAQANPSVSAVDPKRLHKPAGQQVATQSMSENQRMQITNHIGSKNHTVYLVRQPLDLLGSRQVSGVPSTEVASRSSFPDAHEVRRLDGIRAQPINVAHSNQGDGLQRTTMVDDNTRQASNFVVDDADDPTFGFSRRPAVKVVATNALHKPRAIIKAQSTSAAADPRSQMLTGSQTLGRRNIQRDHSLQRGSARENLPTTSSMSNINKTLSAYGPGPISDSSNQNVNPKDSESRQITTNSGNAQKMRAGDSASSNPLQLKQGTTTSKNRPEFAYVLNI